MAQPPSGKRPGGLPYPRRIPRAAPVPLPQPSDSRAEELLLFGDDDPQSGPIPDGYQQANQPARPAQEDWDFYADEVYAEGDHDAFVAIAVDSQAFPNQPANAYQDEWFFIDDGGDYEEPTLDTFEWSNPINPNAPPLPVEDFFGTDLDDFGDEWEHDGQDNRPVGDNPPPLPAEDFQGFDPDDSGDDWEWHVFDSAPVGPDAPVLSASLIEDVWDWDDSPEDEAPVDEVLGPNQPPPILDELWDWNTEQSLEDDYPGLTSDDPVGPNPPSPILDDAWDWDGDQLEPAYSVDSYQQADVVPTGFFRDEWDWDDGGFDDDWQLIVDDDDDVVGPNQPAPVYNDEWLEEELPPDYSVDSYQQSDVAVVGSPLLAYDDAWDWDSDQTQPEYSVDTYQQSDAAVAPGSPLLCYDDAWDWDSEYTQPDYSVDSYQNSDVAAAPSTPIGYGDDAALFDEELEDDHFDHFGNVDALQPIYDDAWDWDQELYLEDGSDSFGTDVVGPNGPVISVPLYQDAPDIFDDEVDDDLIDHFTNYDQLPAITDDAWDWNESVEDEADFGTDVVGANAVAAPPQPVEDPGTDLDDFGDDWESTVSDSAPVGANQPPFTIEDGWDWSEANDYSDDPPDDDGWNVRNPNIVLVAANGPEDGWDWSEADDYSDDPPDDDGSNVQNNNVVPPVVPPTGDTHDYPDPLPKKFWKEEISNTQVIRESDLKRAKDKLKGKKAKKPEAVEPEVTEPVIPVYQDPADDEEALGLLQTDEDMLTAELIELATKLLRTLH